MPRNQVVYLTRSEVENICWGKSRFFSHFVSPVGVTSVTSGDTFLRHDFGKKFKSPHTKNLNSSRISIVGMPSHQVVYLTRSEVANISVDYTNY